MPLEVTKVNGGGTVASMFLSGMCLVGSFWAMDIGDKFVAIVFMTSTMVNFALGMRWWHQVNRR